MLDYVTRRFNVSSAGLKKLVGWTFAETPLNAISRSNWSPESAEVRPLFKAPREKLVPGSTRNWIAVNAVQQLSLNKKYENSRCSKTNSPLAFAARPASDCTGAGYHLRVDSRAGPRNARLR